MSAMRLTFASFTAASLLLTACSGKNVGLGAGEAADARLTADLYTWPCQDTDTGGGVLSSWEGAFSYNLTLEYAPDALADRGFPASGCSLTADMFPTNAGAGAVNLSGVDEPGWSNGSLEGTMPHVSTGFYYKPVFANQRSCQEADDLLGEGTLLASAGALTGAQTPAPGAYEGVTVTGEVDANTGLAFGSTIEVSWEASHWSGSWIQVRREKGGEAVQTVTCNTTGSDGFTVDDAVWSMFSSALEVDVTNLYVAVENTGTTTLSDGQIVETSTRAMHVAVIQD